MIVSAIRATNNSSLYSVPRPASPVARLGLGFEKKFAKALSRVVPSDFHIERNPWFDYVDESGSRSRCCPDLVIWALDKSLCIVVEVKLNWTPAAKTKLDETYCPVLRLSSQFVSVRPLVACKTLSPASPRPQSSFLEAVFSRDPLLLWTGLGPILWS